MSMTKIDRIGRIAAGALIALGLGLTAAFADDEIPASHIKAARAALNSVKVTDPFNGILPNLAQQLKSNLIQGSPNYEELINDTVDQKALELAPRRADLEKEAATIYAKAFTEEELNQIAAFYNSPTGQKLLKDGPLVIRELSKAGDIWATGISRDLAKATDEAMKKAIAADAKKAPKQ